jgi:hypothetical protein
MTSEKTPAIFGNLKAPLQNGANLVILRELVDISGRGAAWLARLHGVQKVASSNLVAPTFFQWRAHRRFWRRFCSAQGFRSGVDRFARIILGYHGAKTGNAAEFARRLLLGEVGLDEWEPSENEFDWLGHGIYFWEHSPERARRWVGPAGIVVGAVIQLGDCLDLTDLYCTELLVKSHATVERSYREKGEKLPKNTVRELKNRKLDCLVINHLTAISAQIQTVRGAFEEGDEAFAGAALRKETPSFSINCLGLHGREHR